jgi:hypothetical protein
MNKKEQSNTQNDTKKQLESENCKAPWWGHLRNNDCGKTAEKKKLNNFVCLAFFWVKQH